MAPVTAVRGAKGDGNLINNIASGLFSMQYNLACLCPLSEWMGRGSGDDWSTANAADPDSLKPRVSGCRKGGGGNEIDFFYF